MLLRYAGFLAVLFVLADALRGGLRPERLAQVYVAACAVAAVCGLLTFAVGADRRVGGPIGDPNDFAFFLLPAVALGLAVRRTTRRRWPWDVATVVVLVAILGTLSRGALVGLAAMAVLAVGAGHGPAARRRRPRGGRRRGRRPGGAWRSPRWSR